MRSTSRKLERRCVRRRAGMSKAIVWFSRLGHEEPMALRGNYLSPDHRSLFVETISLPMSRHSPRWMTSAARGDCLRLRINKSQLFPYPAIFDVAGVPAEVREAAEKAAALTTGSDVRQWHGALDAIPFDQLIVQRWDLISRSWVDAPGEPSLK